MKYAKKTALGLASLGVILSVAAGVTGCVSPLFEKASIEPGLKFDAGVSATSYAQQLADYGFYAVGLRGDVIARYAWNHKIELSAQFGFGAGCFSDIYDGQPLLVDGGLGLKFAFPCKTITPALKIEIEPYGPEVAVAPAFLLGIPGRKQSEAVTLGLRTDLLRGFIPYGLDVFGIIHGKKGFSIFAGLDMLPLIFYEQIQYPPVATIGIGYTIK